MHQKQLIEISTWSILKVIFIILFFGFLFLISNILIVLFLSLIIASAIYPWVNYLESKKIPRILGVLSVYVIAILFIIFLLYLVIPTMVDEIRQLASVLPSYYDVLSSKFSKTVLEISPDYTKTAQDFLINFGEKIKGMASSVLKTVAGVFGGFATLGIVLVISFYMASQEKGVGSFIKLITPKHQEAYVLNLWKRVEKKLGLWLQGQLLLGVIIGLVVFFGLYIIGVPYALLLGVVAGIFEVVPVVGPIFSAFIGIAVALMIDPVLALLTLIFYIIVQQVENNILVPFLMKKMTGLNPIVIIVSLLIGWELGGVLGMIIAVPVATIAGELLDDYARSKER
jgi:predicted PurR-regulated permease PerM